MKPAGSVLLALILAACAQAPRPVPAAVAAPEPAPAAAAPAAPEAPAPAAPEAPAPAAPAAPDRPPTTVVIDPGEASGAPSLLEASRRARERRKTAGPPVAVIDNDNLAEYARRGNLTLIAPRGEPQEKAEAEAAPAEEPRDEAYWRARSRDLRGRWREAHDQIVELETQAEALRLQFYTEEDRYSRDTRIKPAWDRVLDRLRQAREDEASSRGELEALLEEGRKSGALPGWLREGIELEPEPEPEEGGPPDHEIVEPPIAEPPGAGRRRP